MATGMLRGQYILVRVEALMQRFFYDFRFAVRQLRKTPGLALLAIVTLALGVGANTAIFTVIESVLLRPLPYLHADRWSTSRPQATSRAWERFPGSTIAIFAPNRSCSTMQSATRKTAA